MGAGTCNGSFDPLRGESRRCWKLGDCETGAAVTQMSLVFRTGVRGRYGANPPSRAAGNRRTRAANVGWRGHGDVTGRGGETWKRWHSGTQVPEATVELKRSSAAHEVAVRKEATSRRSGPQFRIKLAGGSHRGSQGLALEPRSPESRWRSGESHAAMMSLAARCIVREV